MQFHRSTQQIQYNSPRTKNTKRSKKAAKHVASTLPASTVRCWMQSSTDAIRRMRVHVG